MAIETIGVVGAGQMGNGIAHVLALAGYEVRLNDIDQATPRYIALHEDPPANLLAVDRVGAA